LTSSRQRQDRPIQSVELKVLIEAGPDAKNVREAVPEAKARGKSFEIVISGTDAKEVEAKARSVVERLRKAGVV